jgi:hypothetical protein
MTTINEIHVRFYNTVTRLPICTASCMEEMEVGRDRCCVAESGIELCMRTLKNLLKNTMNGR